MFKIVITGGSGFIGTNLVNLFWELGWVVSNYDIAPPKNNLHFQFWKNVNILDHSSLIQAILIDNPDYIVHLAARTDLKENDSIEGYKTNIEGVRNIMDAASSLQNLKRIVLASSMLVCKLGYVPKSFEDYNPNSLYGESKVQTEKIVKEYDINWTIVRPTSIWGPWFGEPYKNFFDLVINGFYFNIPRKYSSTKTYGFVDNSCYQIFKILVNEDLSINHNFFYLGDMVPINISDWAVRIRRLNNQTIPLTLPVGLLKCTAVIGDILKRAFGISKFPMNTFRYNNMTNDNIIEDLKRTIEITQSEEKFNLDKFILKTLNWLNKNK